MVNLGYHEKTYNLLEALGLAEKLREAGCQVKICREGDIFVDKDVMQERANTFNADICFCLHHNAASSDARGWGVYYASEQSRVLAELLNNRYYPDYMPIPSHGIGPKHATAYNHSRVNNCIKHCTMPTVLLESCFIDNNADLEWLIEDGCKDVIDALYNAARQYLHIDAPPPIITPHDLCETYIDLHHKGKINFPNLMAISFAQWMHESDWCKSPLAKNTLNFGGLKDRPEVNRGGKYFYKNEYYEKFDTLDDFIKGYWEFLNRSPYWRFNQNVDLYENEPEDFIRCIGPDYAEDPEYIKKVLRVYNSDRFAPYRQRLDVPIVDFPEKTTSLGAVLGGVFYFVGDPGESHIEWRLTAISMTTMALPESQEIDLSPYEGQLIHVEYSSKGHPWLYQSAVKNNTQ
ncbi:N-acetylmuramoyl-L-alanine amidase [Desulfobacterales bacterium HSG16]|nr:N-acetylmuramoyl-L-alanine amidase [Desulfobacterales bacterium HSG16]